MPRRVLISDYAWKDLEIEKAKQMAAVLCGTRPENIVNPQVLKQANLRAIFHAPGRA
ncbi:MAG: hypothetical protein ABSA59_06100 [Terriglobia bacterium]|jgi:hypothetical protein